MFIEQIVKITTFLSGYVQKFTYHQDFSSDPHCYKTLSNRFDKSITFNKINNFNKFNSPDVLISKEWIIWCIIIEHSDIIW